MTRKVTRRKPKPGPYKRGPMGYEYFTRSRWGCFTFKRRGPGKRRNRDGWMSAGTRIALTDYAQNPRATRRITPHAKKKGKANG